jgi:hypothetical protein
MPPTEAEMLVARIARMKALVDALEAECHTSERAHRRFMDLKTELEALTHKLKPLDTRSRP